MAANEIFRLERFPTPTGVMQILTDGDGRVRAADWETHDERMRALLRRHYGASGYQIVDRGEPSAARRALEAYFAGDLAALDDLDVHTRGTPFQESVWAALRRIPACETRSYGALAAAIGRPTAVRAVGLANGSNPIAVVVPCHRVIGASGDLTGYGGGLDRKRWLLAHEQRGAAEGC